jgi:hypothetical protein
MQEIFLSRKCITGAMYILITGENWYEIIQTSKADENS